MGWGEYPVDKSLYEDILNIDKYILIFNQAYCNIMEKHREVDMKEPLFCRILKYTLYAVFVLGVICTLTLPLMLDVYEGSILRNTTFSPAYRAFILPFLMIVAIPCLWIVLEMIFMMRSIPKDPFVMRNVAALRRIGLIFFLLSAAFIIKCLFFLTFLTLFCTILFIGCGLFSFTLSALIRQSIVFREENDLTI